MKVVITGSAGFIGSNLVEACLKKGWDVVGIDNLSGGSDEMADPVRVAHLPGHYMFLKEDMNNTDKMTNIFLDIDVVFLLAALPRVSFSTDFPIESHHNNATGTLSVLEAARKANVKRVVYSASSSMYGGSDIEFPTPETTPAKPKSNYALQKHVGLEYCRLYSELYGLDTVSLIYFNVFGPLQRTGSNAAYNTVVTAFMDCAIKGESCRVDGDGLQSRDLCYVDNVVQANILAAIHPDKLMGDTFNIACGETHSVIDVFNKVKELNGGVLEKHHVAPRLGDPRKSHADISKAVSVLGYKPEVKLEEGLDRTWDWWQNGCPIK